MDGLQLAVRQAGVAGVESSEELRQLVHQFEPEHKEVEMEVSGERDVSVFFSFFLFKKKGFNE